MVGRYEVSQSLARKFGEDMCDKVIEEIVNEDEDDKEDIDLLKIDQNDGEDIDIQQVHLEPEQVDQLEDIGKKEYFEKLNDIFGDKK